MFKLQDGRDHFWQWDSDRKLIIEDASITEVHFSNRTDDYSLVVKTYVENGITLVNVPNILLQTDWRIHVYAVDGNYTKHEKCYEIVARTKPSDYVYTETEIINWQYIKTQLDSKADVLDLETVEAALDNKKVDKVDGKGLSTNDYTDTDKAEVEKVKDKANIDNVLTKDNTTEYTPSTDYNPATKKYVDKKDERIKYYGDPDIIPSPKSYFTVNSTGETITGLTDEGKTQTELVIPYEINGVKITNLASGSENDPLSILDGNNVITKVILPNTIINIGKFAFVYCTSLISVNIPDSVTTIGYAAFFNCESLSSITIPNSVINIDEMAFQACTSLTSINIPNSVTSIGIHAFYYCISLKSITIPNSVISIGAEAITTTSENRTIYCEQGSYAETYAKTNNISVKYTDISAIEFNNKADKATTLEGYGITDAYTKTEVEAYINETILGGAW